MGDLTPHQRTMLISSEPCRLGGGCGVELRTGADYAVAKALERRELGHVEGPGGPLCGLYFNNDDGMSLRADLLGETDADEWNDEVAFEAMNRGLA